jgi:glycosyltransferase involved in cell wall biosynthesis
MRGDVKHVLMTADAVGGVRRYTIDLARTLATRGVQTSVAVLGPSPTPAQRVEADRLGVAIIDRPFRLEWMMDPWDDVERAGQWLLALERTLSPDVVHLNGYCHAALPWQAPVVVVAHSCVRSWWRAVHGMDAPPAWDRYHEAVRQGLTAADRVVAPTTTMLAALEDEYGVTTSGRVIPNGLSSSAPDAAAKQPFLLAAGRLWDEAKNIDSLCAIASQVAWPIYVAGEERAPGGEVCALGAVRHLGRLEPAELAEWYRRASIYALPARYEPFGLSVLEAASAGCALVLGDIRSLRENWSGAAEFVPPDNRRALAAAINALIADPARREDLAARALARAARFTMTATADAYVSLYEELAGTRPSLHAA